MSSEEQEEQNYLNSIHKMKMHRKYARNDKLQDIIQKVDKLDYIPKCHKCQGILSYYMVQKRSMDEGMTTVYHCRNCH
jgi:DNA-directed RNA polymerase subunit M/transcription elongation factor TFIIS